MNPEKLEIESTESGVEERLGEAGFAEVPTDMTERIKDRTRADLYELPNELRRSFDRVAPGLGSEIFSRAQEISGKYLRQLDNSTERNDTNQYGEFNDNTAVSDDRETLKFGDINRIVTGLKMLVDQLDDQARRQQGDTKIIDLDKLDGGEARAVPEFWYLLTGESEYGSGHESQVGAYTLSSSQSQEASGPGSESRKLIIAKTEVAAQQDSAVVEEVEAADDTEVPSNVIGIHEGRKRLVPATKYERTSHVLNDEESKTAA